MLGVASFTYLEVLVTAARARGRGVASGIVTEIQSEDNVNNDRRWCHRDNWIADPNNRKVPGCLQVQGAGERGHLPRHGPAPDPAGLAALGRGHPSLLANLQTPATGQGCVVRAVSGAFTIILTIKRKYNNY